MSQPGKPTVAIFTLGGTIAMLQTPDGGVAPALSASDLLAAVPRLDRIEAQLQVHDFLNKPGASLTLADIFSLAKAIGNALNEGCIGAVVTQGTDTRRRRPTCSTSSSPPPRPLNNRGLR